MQIDQSSYIDSCHAIGVTPLADVTQYWWHRSLMTEAGQLDAAEFRRICAAHAEPLDIPARMQVIRNADGSLDIWSPSGARCAYSTVPSKAAVGAAIRELLAADGTDLKVPDAWYLTKSER